MASTAPHTPNSDDILGSHRFTPAGQASGSVQAPTANSVLGSAALDPSALHPLAGVVGNKELDYLLLEDDQLSTVAGGKTVLPSRGWGDELCYGTGSTYLAGLAFGGLWGLTEGFRRPVARPSQSTAPLAPATAATGTAAEAAASSATATAPKAASVGQQATAFAKQAVEGAAAGANANASQTAAKVSARLRWNNVLNQVTRRGTSMGNSAGVLALIYNGINSSIDVYRGGFHDVYGSMGAAAVTGLIWRSTAGLKSMAITSGLLTVGAAGWSYAKLQLL
ncbi:protein transporter TIM23 [Sporobolomyces salmoneus]|uniref:protein transporter TIM23 n=1 Tax=Sporobolomyces salmoneus TaxID=183962 RepID=UPI00317EACA9